MTYHPASPHRSPHLPAPRRAAAAIALLLAWLSLALPLLGQTPQSVYTDDSPEAAELLRRAAEHEQAGNTSESVRLYDELLRLHPRRLVREQTHPGLDQFRTVRETVHDRLLAAPDLLRRYRDIADPRSEETVAAGDLETAALSFLLTPAGLDAALNLAEMDLRRARFDSAAARLDDLRIQPELTGDRRTRWAAALGLVGIYGNRSDLLDEAVAILDEQDADEAAEGLRRRLASFEPPLAPARFELLSPRAPLPSPESSDSATWQFAPDEEVNDEARESMNPTSRDAFRASLEQGHYLRSLPLVSEDAVYYSDGVRLTALDRFDSRPRWRYAAQTDLDAATLVHLRTTAFDGYSFDPAAVALDGRSVFAVLRRSGQEVARLGPNSLVSVDARTGSLRWSISPRSYAEPFSDAGFAGVPLLHEGRIIILLREIQQQLVTDRLLAFDADTGGLLWSQYLSSVGLPRNLSQTFPPTVGVISDGTLYITSPTGTVAALDPALGLVRWLVRLESDVRYLRYVTYRPFEFSQPVLTAHGLFVIAPDCRSIHRLDADTGAPLGYITRTTLNNPLYLLADEHYLYAVGNLISRAPLHDVRPETVETFWVQPPDDPLFGRVRLTDDGLAVPTRSALSFIDAESGRTRNARPLESPGLPVLTNAEILVVTAQGIDSYITYEQASAELRRRMAADPADPTPAISLAGVADRHGYNDEVLDAVDSAMQIILRGTDPSLEVAQAALFEQLLDMASRPRAADDPFSRELFTRLGLLTATVNQRAAYLFAHAAYLTRAGRPEAAVEQLQTIASSVELASTYVEENSLRTRASVVAAARLAALLRQHGRAAYQPWEDAAAEALQRAARRDSPADLLAVASAYPRSVAAVQAALRAADLYESRQRPDQAARVLQDALASDLDPADRAALWGRLLILLDRPASFDAFEFYIARWRQRYPDMRLQHPDGDLVTPHQWRTRSADRSNLHPRQPALGDFEGTSVGLITDERLLAPRAGANHHLYFFTQVRGSGAVRCRRAPELSLAWELDSRDDSVELLHVDAHSALFWITSRRRAPQLTSISLDAGVPLWTIENVTALVHPDSTGGADDLFIRIIADHDAVYLAQVNGRLSSVGRDDGALRWSRALEFDSFTSLSLGADLVAVAGERHHLDPQAQQTRRGSVLLLNARDGSVELEHLLAPDDLLNWMVLTETGRFCIGSSREIRCIDLAAGVTRWTLHRPLFLNAAWVEVIGDTLLLTTSAGGEPARINLLDGQAALDPDIASARIGRGEYRLYRDLGRYVLRTSRGLYIYDAWGTLIGELARSGSPHVDIRALALGDDRIAVIESREPVGELGPEPPVIYFVDYTGRRFTTEIAPEDAQARPRSDLAQAVDSAIIFDAGGYLYAVTTR